MLTALVGAATAVLITAAIFCVSLAVRLIRKCKERVGKVDPFGGNDSATRDFVVVHKIVDEVEGTKKK